MVEGGRKKEKVEGVLRSSGREGGRWGVFVLPAPKIVDGGSSEPEDRRTPPCSIFGTGRSKNPPIFDLRSSTPKIEEPPIYDLRSSTPKTSRVQKPDIPRAGRGGAAHGGAAGRGRAGRDADGSVRPGDNRPSCPQGIVDNCPERPPRSTNKGNPM